MDGVLIIRKEKGYTSHDVVARLRGILRMKRIGHTGTLDPQAEGVLPVLLGRGTRLSELLTEKEKTYEALMRLGIETDTQDMSGRVLEQREVSATEEEVRSVMESFLGEGMQVPPMYSARKVNGKKLYEIAREGKVVERAPRPVCFSEMEILEMSLPLVRFRVTCSSGTYIRTLCHDIGQKLGCGACMEELLRTRTGSFALEQSHTLEEVRLLAENGEIQSLVLGVEEVLETFPRILCKEEGDRLLKNGNPLSREFLTADPGKEAFRLCGSDGNFAGIYQWKEDRGRFCPVKMFL